ncbi:hypothetical protein PAEPH01_1615 [Pancytospora epiphaga]|nr:hypothetical protein PAEPH01_1615 [Pancytospora epiphaga]
MYCTTCEIITEGVRHYKSRLHAVNIQRRAYGYTPLSSEEVDLESKTDDLVFDINHEHETSLSSECANVPSAYTNGAQCLFCEQADTIKHYKEHGLSDEEITYIKRLQCPICYERFVTKALLLKHLDVGAHRTAVTDGQSLYLENGRILNPNRRNMETETGPVVRSELVGRKIESNTNYEEFLDKRRLDEYKCGVSRGRSFRKTPF